MGIVISGLCACCHRTGRLSVDEKYCSEACKIRYETPRPPATFGEGFMVGVCCATVFFGIIVSSVTRQTPLKQSTEMKRAEALYNEVQTLDTLLHSVARDVSNSIVRLRTETPEKSQ